MNEQKLYVSKLIVLGSGKFPFDMLRYDSCMPWGPMDTNKLAQSHRVEGAYSVELRCVRPDARGAETRRWQAFGWQVVEENFLTTWSA